MGAPVTNGADTVRLRQVAEGLSVSARRVLEVEQEGATSIGTLVESWGGPDTQVFAADWQSAGPQLVAAAELLSALARQLVEQAEQQDEGSEGSGRGGGPERSTPGSRAGDPMGDLAGLVPRLFDVKNGDGRYWPDMTAAAGPRFGPQDPVTGYLLDRATDWANDVYTDHVRDRTDIPKYEWALKESSDWLRDVKDEYLKKKTNPLPFDGPSILLDVAADTLEEYGKILHDPKGWWDNDATIWDKVGIAVSLVPGLGLLGKAVVKTTKEAFDVVAKGFKHADDVKTPHGPHVPKKSTVDPGSGPDAHDTGNPNKGSAKGDHDGARQDGHDDGNPNTDPDPDAPPAKQIGHFTVPDDAVTAKSGGKGGWNHDLYDPKPDTTYLVDDRFVYVTDEHGRVKEAHGILEDNPRDRAGHRQRLVGGDDRLPGDEGGHIFGRATGGPGEDINMVSMSSKANGSAEYGRLEAEWRNLVREDPPREVVVSYYPVFDGASERPTKFVIEWTKDGQPQDTEVFYN